MLKLIKKSLKKLYIKASQLYYAITGSKVECNICHYKANKLGSNRWHLYTVCPNCDSRVRNRLLFAAFTYCDDFSFGKLINDKSVLHFAPEASAREIIRSKAKNYKTADLFAGYAYENIDYNIDISDMKAIGDASFDCVIACDVLEHVYNDKNAVNEVNRVLKSDGCAIFTVPQKDNLMVTYEDQTITDPKERERIFGQADHVRIYGDDFADILEKQGFKVKIIDEHSFDNVLVKKFVLAPPILSTDPLATNYRKVFFAQRAGVTVS